MLKLFFSYSHADEQLRDELEKHLAMLKRQGAIDTWHDRRIGAGVHIDQSIDTHLQEARIVLLLVSPDFLASDYCYEAEMLTAMERHERGEATVIPVILRPCDWHGAPFGRINALPTDGLPVTKYPNIDEAFLEITQGIRKVSDSFSQQRSSGSTSAARPTVSSGDSQPRSSNLRLTKAFTDHDRDTFLDEAFDYIARFFENSLNELKARNPEIDVRFRLIGVGRFTAAVYKSGEARSRCTIWRAARGSLGDGIAYAYGETDTSSQINESLSVDDDGHTLFLKPLLNMQSNVSSLSPQGAAEYFWARFIDSLQH